MFVNKNMISEIIKQNDELKIEINNLKEYSEYLAKILDGVVVKLNEIVDVSTNPEWEKIKNKIDNGVLDFEKFSDE